MTNSENFFFTQNCILKFAAVLLGTVVSLFIKSSVFQIIFAATILYFIGYPYLYLLWLKTLLLIIPLFISLLLAGILFGTSFPKQILLLERISFIMLLSVYLVHTGSLAEILAQLSSWKNKKFFFVILYFFVATFGFIPLILREFGLQSKNSKNFMKITVNSFHSALTKMKEVETASLNKLTVSTQTKPFLNFPNLYLMLLITLYFLSVSF